MSIAGERLNHLCLPDDAVLVANSASEKNEMLQEPKHELRSY